MKPSILASLVLLTCIAIATVESSSLSYLSIHNDGTIIHAAPDHVTFTIYNDTGLKTPANLTGLSNSTFSPSQQLYNPDYFYRIFYGVLTANKTENVTLNIYTENWNPPITPNYMTLYAYRNLSSLEVTELNGSTLQAPATIIISLCLYIPAGCPIKTFTFDIVFNTHYSGEP
jgi:hypothetical protein